MKTRTNKRMVGESEDDLSLHSSSPPMAKTPKSKKTKKDPVTHQVSDDSSDSFAIPLHQSMKTTPSRKSTKKSKAASQTASPASLTTLGTLSTLPDNFFRGPSYESRFRQNIAFKQCVFEKSLDQVLYHDSSLHNLFESCQISSLLFPPTVVYPQLVQQFYSNLESHEGSFTTFVKGKSLFFTAHDFGSILQIPYSGPCPFTLKGALNSPISALEQLQTVMKNPSISTVFTPKSTDVCPIAGVLHKIVRYNLLPRHGGGANFTYQDLVLIALIMQGTPFNMAQLMLNHMLSCIRQVKTCLPYSASLTNLFQHFHISFENEVSMSPSEPLDSALLKQSRLYLVNGEFVRTPSDVPNSPSPPSPSSPVPNTSNSSPEVLGLLNSILQNQLNMQTDLTDIKTRLSVLEKNKFPMSASHLNNIVRNFEDEFIDLQAGFELQTMAMTEALQRKLNRNACQLSHEIKFVSHQVGELSEFTASRFNAVAHELNIPRKSSNVDTWPKCNWMDEYRGDFLDVPLPDASFIPRPIRFARELSNVERAHRAQHRPYFTQRAAKNVHCVNLE